MEKGPNSLVWKLLIGIAVGVTCAVMAALIMLAILVCRRRFILSKRKELVKEERQLNRRLWIESPNRRLRQISLANYENHIGQTGENEYLKNSSNSDSAILSMSNMTADMSIPMPNWPSSSSSYFNHSNFLSNNSTTFSNLCQNENLQNINFDHYNSFKSNEDEGYSAVSHPVLHRISLNRVLTHSNKFTNNTPSFSNNTFKTQIPVNNNNSQTRIEDLFFCKTSLNFNTRKSEKKLSFRKDCLNKQKLRT